MGLSGYITLGISISGFIGGIGVRQRHSYSTYMGWYGMDASDLSRYLKWETLGI